MKIKDLFNVHKALTTSREFFSNNSGIMCVHYGDIYKNYSFKTIDSSNIINKFSLPVEDDKLICTDSLIMPDVTETISDFGHITYIRYTNHPYINGTHTFALTSKDNNKNKLKYIYYYFQSPKIRKLIQSYLLGSTVFQLSKKDLENFELINIHNEEEQQHIIDIIGSLDEKIENNNKMTNKIFDNLYYFHLDYRQNSELKNTNILDICDIKYGKGIPTSKLKENAKYSVYGSNGIIGYLDDYMFDKNKVAISCRGNSSGILHLTEKYSTITSNSLFLDFKKENYTYYFYLEFFKKGLYEFKTGSAQPQITIDNLAKLTFDIPINIEQYNENVIKQMDLIFKIKEENKKLNELKQLYLKKFFG